MTLFTQQAVATSMAAWHDRIEVTSAIYSQPVSKSRSQLTYSCPCSYAQGNIRVLERQVTGLRASSIEGVSLPLTTSDVEAASHTASDMLVKVYLSLPPHSQYL